MNLKRLRLVLMISSVIFLTNSSMASKNQHSAGDDGLFFYLNQKKRVDILEELHDSLKSRYIGWQYKKEKLGIDGDVIFDQAIKTELSTVSGTSRLNQAQDNLLYFDRLLATIAKFKDGHLRVQPTHKLPTVGTGVYLAEADGRFFVVAYRKIAVELSVTKFKQINRLALGDEVIQVDGKPVIEKVNELLPFISASSLYAARMEAVRRLSERRFYYPNKNFSVYRFRSKLDRTEYNMKLLWVKKRNSYRWDAEEVLGLKRISSSRGYCEGIEAKEIKRISKYSQSTNGFNYKDTPKNMNSFSKFFESKDLKKVVFTTGIWGRNSKEYGVVQIFSMVDEIFSEKGKHDQRSEIALFLSKLKKRKIPLILDNRYNHGGSAALVNFWASFFVPQTAPQSAYPSSIYLDDFGQRVIMESKQEYRPAKRVHDPLAQFYQTIESKIKAGYRYSPLVAQGPDYPIPDERVFYFDLPVVSLISPVCMSACERLSRLFKQNEKISLIGTQSHGTGLGFKLGTIYDDIRFKDSYHAIWLEIPNQAGGMPSEEGIRSWDKYEIFQERMVENVPVKADIYYRSTLNDYLNRSEGWFIKAAEVLLNQ